MYSLFQAKPVFFLRSPSTNPKGASYFCAWPSFPSHPQTGFQVSFARKQVVFLVAPSNNLQSPCPEKKPERSKPLAKPRSRARMPGSLVARRACFWRAKRECLFCRGELGHVGFRKWPWLQKIWKACVKGLGFFGETNGTLGKWSQRPTAA